MSIPNFNLFNKFCFDEADETLSHVFTVITAL